MDENTPMLLREPDGALFWSLFSNDYTQNCLAWQHAPANPVLPPSGETWKRVWTANPDLLLFQEKLLLYYRGHGVWPGREGNHDRLAVAEVAELSGAGLALRDLTGDTPIVDVGAAGSFDDQDVLDPAAVVFQNKVYLYYSAVGAEPDSIGLAVSEDGVHFDKMGKVLEGRAPDAVVRDGRLYLLWQKPLEGGGYALFLSVSDDGRAFTSVQPEPVFVPEPKQWDSFSVVTARVWQSGGVFYLLYGGSSYLPDEPEYFGLARSPDLIRWERHPGSPIFGGGPRGAPDGGAIWFPALWETESEFVLLYEGSRGKYRWDLSSAICLASLSKQQKSPGT